MALKGLIVALSFFAATSAAASQTTEQRPATAPPGNAQTRYCMHIEPITGSRMPSDVDQEWPKEGVRVIG